VQTVGFFIPQSGARSSPPVEPKRAWFPPKEQAWARLRRFDACPNHRSDPMAQTVHDPAAPDVKGDDYDPAFDDNKDGVHDQTENENRARAAKNYAEHPELFRKWPPGIDAA